MVEERMLLIAGALGSVIPHYARNTIHSGKLSIIPEIILLEGLLTCSCSVHTAELAHIHRDALCYEVGVELLEHLLKLGLIVTGYLL